MRRKSMTAVLLCLAAVAVLALASAPSVAKRNVNPRVIPPQAKPFGMSYGDWGARWWQWLATTPVEPQWGTGSNTGEGQSGPVWFLGANYDWVWDEDPPVYYGEGTADYTVTMPAGRAVFVPLVKGVSSDPAMSEAELRANVAWGIDHLESIFVSVDGRMLRDPWSYRCTSRLFQLEWVAGNLWQNEPAPPTNSVSDGYWVMLAPLPVGNHVISSGYYDEWTPDVDGVEGGYGVTETYHITVTPR